jgi:phage tail sheath protein FI
MAEYLAPGVFIEEIERGPRPIEGVSTSTAAFLGETERGPTWPRLVTNFNEFVRYFGTSFADGKYLPDAASGFFDNGGQRLYVCRIVGAGATTATLDLGGLTIAAAGPGDAGNRIFVKLVGGSTRRNGNPIGFRLQVAYWQTPSPSNTYPDPFAGGQPQLPLPTLREDFDDLVWDDPSSPDYVLKRLATASALIRVSLTGGVALAAAPAGPFTPLAGGTDAAAAPGLVEYQGENADASLRTGLSALELDEFRGVALVYAPAAADDVAQEVYEHCQREKFRFAVIDAPKSSADVSTITPRDKWDTTYAAFYYPWIGVADLRSGQRKLVPPGGHVLGL